MKIINGASIIFVFGIFFLVWNSESNKIDYQLSEKSGRFEIKTGSDSYFVYQTNSQPLMLVGSAVSVDPVTGAEGAGSFLGVNFLTLVDVDKFESKYGRSAACPAPFLNKYVRSNVLLAANSEVALSLDAWTLRADSESHRWETFSLEGLCIERMVEGVREGEVAELHDNYFQNCRFILVNKLERD